MRNLMSLQLLGAIAIIHCATAWGQTCYTPVQSWQGTYTITGTANDGTCGVGTSCVVNQSATVGVAFPPILASCSSVTFFGSDSPFQATVNDSVSVKCPPPTGPRTVTINTTATTGGNASSSSLTVNGSSTYVYSPGPVTNADYNDPGCGGGGTNPTNQYVLYPFPPDWPPTSALPASVQTLTGPPAFTGTDSILFAATNWDFAYTLEPNYTDDSNCSDDGNSTIGCQNQSLGEDLPIVGTGLYLHYEGTRAPGAGASGLAPQDAAMLGGWTLSIHHVFDPASNTLFGGDGSQRNGQQMGTPVAYNNLLLVTSEDGSEVYEFDTSSGHHVETARPLTGAMKYVFGYDAAGALVTVTDAAGNVIKIQRDSSEKPTAIISPFGQTTTLSVDSNGFLSQVTDPLGKSSTFVNSNTGLLLSRTDANGNTFNYSYDTQGRLSKDADPLGGFTGLARTNATSGFGWTTAETTAMGRTSSYQSAFTLPWIQDGTHPESVNRVLTWPNGLQATSNRTLQNGQLSDSITLPNGRSDTSTSSPDPVWGLQAPVVSAESMVLGNLTMKATGSRTTTLGTTGNPFTVSALTESHTFNGRNYTSAFSGSNRSYVNTTPVGRTQTTSLDSLERLISAQTAGLNAMNLGYDTRGRLASITQGTRSSSFSYDSNGFLATMVDPLKQTTSFSYDADGRILTTTLPDSQVIDFSYDANGNLTSLTPPGGSTHQFAYNAVNLVESYTPPAVAGSGATKYAYDLDRNLTTITRPDGETIKYGYDTAGRLTSVATPTGTTTYTYSPTTGNLAGVGKSAEHIAFSYNGPLLTKSNWTGMVAGSVSQSYNNNFWVASESINGSNTVAFKYDNDGLVTKAGSFTINHSPKNGLITGTILGMATDARSYNGFGELIGYTASVNGAAVYKVKYTRDADGRVSTKAETINGISNSYSYTYDLEGRLAAAIKNATTDTYTYDSNSNRLSATTSSGTSNATYDAQDRMLTYGNASFTYTANGELTSQKIGSQQTTYHYDVLGNLTAVTLPNGNKISYIIDGENRRVGKQVNGALVTGYLYDGGRIVAQLNGSNQLVNQFVYAGASNSPDYMISGGAVYRIFSDPLGSPVLIVNSATGTLTEEITYDEFGNVLSDTNPGFQPFGFAGGLYDPDTKFVRFGVRDYDPMVGRWTAKDPVLFDGGDTNLYGYAQNDPINLIDQGGTDGADAGIKQYGADAGTPIWVRQTKESLELLKEINDDYKKCQKAVKFIEEIRKADGTTDLVTKQATSVLKDKVGAQNETKQLLNQAHENTPAVQNFGDTLVNGGGWRDAYNALSGKTCPNCSDKGPTPHRQKLKEYHNSNP